MRESSCGGDSITDIALAINLAISLPCLILVLSDTTMTFGFLCFVTVSTSHKTKLQPDVKRGFVDTPSGGFACLARGPQRGSPELVDPAAALSALTHQAEPAASGCQSHACLGCQTHTQQPHSLLWLQHAGLLLGACCKDKPSSHCVQLVNTVTGCLTIRRYGKPC